MVNLCALLKSETSIKNNSECYAHCCEEHLVCLESDVLKQMDEVEK